MTFQHLSLEDRKKMQAKLQKLAESRPEVLTQVPRIQWPSSSQTNLKAVWHSKDYLVQIYYAPHGFRISVNRLFILDNGHWEDNISWDELMRIKRQIGFGDWYGVEVYPKDQDIVNDANIRHLWILEKPLDIGWVNGK